jgi:Uma2 family endonuclease
MVIATTGPDVVNGVHYPSSDGEPMAETGIHVQTILLLLQAVEDLLAGRTDFYAAADMYWYYEEGNPRARCAPDVMVIFGVPHRPHRRSFMSWRESAIPAVVFEMASENTWRDDVGRKRDLYERLGVPEYFIFDPTREYLDAPLLGFRLSRKRYRPVASAEDGSMESRQLGALLTPEGIMLRLTNAKTGAKVPTQSELVEEERRRAAEERRAAKAKIAEERRKVSEQAAEIARLKAELEALKKGPRG